MFLIIIKRYQNGHVALSQGTFLLKFRLTQLLSISLGSLLWVSVFVSRLMPTKPNIIIVFRFENLITLPPFSYPSFFNRRRILHPLANHLLVAYLILHSSPSSQSLTIVVFVADKGRLSRNGCSTSCNCGLIYMNLIIEIRELM